MMLGEPPPASANGRSSRTTRRFGPAMTLYAPPVGHTNSTDGCRVPHSSSDWASAPLLSQPPLPPQTRSIWSPVPTPSGAAQLARFDPMPRRTVSPGVQTPVCLTTQPQPRVTPVAAGEQGRNCSHGVAGNDPGAFDAFATKAWNTDGTVRVV